MLQVTLFLQKKFGNRIYTGALVQRLFLVHDVMDWLGACVARIYELLKRGKRHAGEIGCKIAK